VCVPAVCTAIRWQQMGLAGSDWLRQYVPSMLTRRSRSGRSSTRAGVVRGASRHLLSLSGLGALLAVFAQGLTSCGSDDDSGGVCDPGALRACVVAGQSCEASQTCNMDGSGYGECACPSQGSAGAAGVGGSGGGSSGGAAGAGGGGGDIEPIFPLGFRAVGAPCETDADCPAGPNGETPLICMTPTSTVEFGTGSPQ